MGTNCALLLTDLFLYLYEADFIPGLLKKKEKKLALKLNGIDAINKITKPRIS
jgi:hypothetical protein